MLSLCTDKATSRNTAHPNIARNQQTKENGGKDGKLDFSLQGVLQHGHALHLFGLYPWITKKIRKKVCAALATNEGVGASFKY